MNIQKMMQQVQQMQKDMQTAQEGLAQEVVEASVGGGTVQVTGSGTGEITGIKISPEAIDSEDIELLQDLLLSGVQQIQKKARQLSQERIGDAAQGLPLPPGLGF
ncbi:MAG: YbaB/EbfC family nucleoid-associated protein [Verrucomicrobiota bacterium]